ncbi:MAG: MBL fold metallo-hydrolase [Hyphomicrobiales bacterium]|nr:MBL fold metallo-hydrolase [Hyphomicrobiales bacterium]
MTFRLTIMGCGSSAGVPRVAQGWGECDPSNPKNRRRRCAIHVERRSIAGATQVVVDLGPDIREQLIDQRVQHVDGILLTHAHADHIHGIDDVRPLVIEQRSRLPVYMDAFTAGEVKAKFGYIFETPPGSQYPPLLTERRLVPGSPVVIDGPGGPVEALPIRFNHGDIDALGFRFGNIAYSPDVKDIPAESIPLLEGLDLWILDALRYRRHPSHLTVDEALGWIARLKPRRAVLTNLHTDLDYARLARELPPHVIPAHDGLSVTHDVMAA